MTVTQLTYDVITLTAPAAVTMTAAVNPYTVDNITTLTAPSAVTITASVNPYTAPETQFIAAPVLPPVTRTLNTAVMPSVKVISIPSGGGGDTRGNDGLVWPTGVQRFGTAPS